MVFMLLSRSREYDHDPDTDKLCTYCCPVSVIIVIACFAAIIYIEATSKDIEHPDFVIQSARISPFNVTGASLLADWNISVLVKNPNPNTTFVFEVVEAEILYDTHNFKDDDIRPKYMLGVAHVSVFNLTGLSTTVMPFRLMVDSDHVNQGVMAAIRGEKEKGSVAFDLKVALNANNVPKHDGEIYACCGKLNFDGSGNFINGPKNCTTLPQAGKYGCS